MATELTQARLKEVLRYDPDSGVFTRLAGSSQFAGLPAGGRRSGYVVIVIDGARYYAHRLAFLYVTGHFPTSDVDHRDGNRLNNAWANLRSATRSENNQNLPVRNDNTSGHVGVSLCKQTGRWAAYINTKGKRFFLGRFDTQEEASAARREAKCRLHDFQPIQRAA